MLFGFFRLSSHRHGRPVTCPSARDVERHHRYYLKLWRRAQANDMPLNDPFVQGICRAWDGVNQLAQLIERMKNRLPQHYRPLAKSTKPSGLLERELPWAGEHRRAAEEVEAARWKPRAGIPLGYESAPDEHHRCLGRWFGRWITGSRSLVDHEGERSQAPTRSCGSTTGGRPPRPEHGRAARRRGERGNYQITRGGDVDGRRRLPRRGARSRTRTVTPTRRRTPHRGTARPATGSCCR
jgi:hypothetical protein